MKLKYSWVIFILSLLLLVPIKVYNSVTGNNFVIGNISSSTSSSIFITVTIILVLAIIIMCLVSKNVLSTINLPKNIFLGIVAFLVGNIMIISGILDFISLVHGIDAKKFFLAVSIILSGIAFIFISNIHFTGKNIFMPMPLLALLPTIWACVRLSVLFLYHSSIVSGQIDMFDIIASVFLILFFFAQSKIMAYIQGPKLVQKLFAFGMPCVLMLLIHNLPSMFTVTSVHDFSMMYVVDILLALYIVSLLISISSPSYIDSNENEYSMYKNRQNQHNAQG